ncbi:MAG: SH3 domain-containing protein [Synergistaceae bacterium]|jgi:uncharacterized Zn finger protein (UPF0148 family)|nr:SH3 domain-containing protein [Synergistaceae bacterium]
MSGHFCQKCGVVLNEGDIFCYSCGAEQYTDIPGEPEITPESASGTTPDDVPKVAGDAVPPPEPGKFCAFCGMPMHSSDRFCEKCGRDQIAPSRHVKYPKKKKNGGRERKKNSLAGLVFLALFWCLVGFGFYAAYKAFWNDIPWNEVMAVVTGRRAGQPDDDYSEEPASELMENLPPIAPEEESQNAQLTGDARTDGAPLPGERVVWTERDSAGRSRLVIIGESGEHPASLPGSVTGTRIRLREKPNSNSKILGMLSKGDIIEVIGRYSSERGKFPWYNVNHDNLSGWMYGEYVSIEEKEN